MKLSDFKSLIAHLPFRNHAFTIKRSNWNCGDQSTFIDSIFSTEETIILNRYDLYSSTFPLPVFALKTLMWGYPTKGRGTNIDKLLEPRNFNALISLLETYSEKDITTEELRNDINGIQGLGLSTMSKLITFLGTRISGMKPAILDLRIIDVINSGRFEELDGLTPIRYDNAAQKYGDYVSLLNKMSNELDVEVDQLEMFLFIFGKSVSEVKGEYCYDYN